MSNVLKVLMENAQLVQIVHYYFRTDSVNFSRQKRVSEHPFKIMSSFSLHLSYTAFSVLGSFCVVKCFSEVLPGN